MRLGPARLLLAGGRLIPGTIEVEDGTITGIDAGAGIPDGILAPGFIDLQVNGRGGVDVATAAGAEWEQLERAAVAQGVTAWCPTLVTAPLDAYQAPLARIAEAKERLATIIGAHLEGPFLGGAPGAHATAHIVGAALSWIAELPKVVRVVTLAPEAPNALEAIELLHRGGVTVSLGHSTATFSQTLQAVEAGATLVTHLFNGMGPLHHRHPGLLGAALSDDRLAVSIIADGRHVAGPLVRLAFRVKPAGRVVLVTDAVASDHFEMVDGLPRLADGIIAGSTLGMDEAVRNAVDFGVSREDALVAATTAPADVVGLADRGRLAVGARADLCLLDDDLAPRQVWVAGTLAWER